MPLLAAGYLTAKPGQHGTPESGRSNHPLILYDIARSHRCTVSKCLHHSQTASSVVTQDRHPQPVLEARHRVRAKPSALQALYFGVSQILHGSLQSVHAVLANCNFVSFAYVEGRQPLPVQKRLVSQWPVTGLPEKRLPKGNPTVDSRLSIMGTTSFWPTAGPANWSPSGFQMRDLPAREQF